MTSRFLHGRIVPQAVSDLPRATLRSGMSSRTEQQRTKLSVVPSRNEEKEIRMVAAPLRRNTASRRRHIRDLPTIRSCNPPPKIDAAQKERVADCTTRAGVEDDAVGDTRLALAMKQKRVTYVSTKTTSP